MLGQLHVQFPLRQRHELLQQEKKLPVFRLRFGGGAGSGPFLLMISLREWASRPLALRPFLGKGLERPLLRLGATKPWHVRGPPRRVVRHGCPAIYFDLIRRSIDIEETDSNPLDFVGVHVWVSKDGDEMPNTSSAAGDRILDRLRRQIVLGRKNDRATTGFRCQGDRLCRVGQYDRIRLDNPAVPIDRSNLPFRNHTRRTGVHDPQENDQRPIRQPRTTPTERDARNFTPQDRSRELVDGRVRGDKLTVRVDPRHTGRQ